MIYPGTDVHPHPSSRISILEVSVDDLAPYLRDNSQLNKADQPLAKESHTTSLADSSPTTPSPSTAASTVGDRKTVEKRMKTLKALAGEFYSSDSNSIIIPVRRFPTYGENKKFSLDCLVRLIRSSKIHAEGLEEEIKDFSPPAKHLSNPSSSLSHPFASDSVPEFPEEWKRVAPLEISKVV